MTTRVLTFPADRARKTRRRRASAGHRETQLVAGEQQEPEAFGRGVWMAPWVGQNGETILVAVGDNRRLVCEVTVPLTASARLVSDELWDRLDAEPPAPMLTVMK